MASYEHRAGSDDESEPSRGHALQGNHSPAVTWLLRVAVLWFGWLAVGNIVGLW